MNFRTRQGPKVGLLFTGVILFAGCAASPPVLDTGADAEPTFDGLYPVRNSVMDHAWARPDIDLTDYSKVMLVGAGIAFRPGGETRHTRMPASATTHFEVSAQQRDALREIMVEAFTAELSASDRFELVSSPGPDVLMVYAALLDVVSNLPPEPAGRGDIYIRQVGEATLLLELRDPISGTVLARAIDRRAAAGSGDLFIPTNRAATTREVRRVAQFWARRLREGLEAQMGTAAGN
jgi:hypothetical protein